MNKNVDLQIIKILYSQHKQYLVPTLMIIVSVFLMFFALIPQFQDLLMTFSKRSDAEQKLQILTDNLNLLASTGDRDLDEKLGTALRALPSEKDFESVLTTISYVGNRAGVPVGNFDFRVGDLSTTTTGADLLPSLGINLILNDGASGASRFMTYLAESLPLSEVTKIDVNANYTTLSIAFYYKSLSATEIQPDVKLMPLSPKQAEVLDKILAWDNAGRLTIPVFPEDFEVPEGLAEDTTVSF